MIISAKEKRHYRVNSLAPRQSDDFPPHRHELQFLIQLLDRSPKPPRIDERPPVGAGYAITIRLQLAPRAIECVRGLASEPSPEIWMEKTQCSRVSELRTRRVISMSSIILHCDGIHIAYFEPLR